MIRDLHGVIEGEWVVGRNEKPGLGRCAGELPSKLPSNRIGTIAPAMASLAATISPPPDFAIRNHWLTQAKLPAIGRDARRMPDGNPTDAGTQFFRNLRD